MWVVEIKQETFYMHEARGQSVENYFKSFILYKKKSFPQT